MRLFTAWRASFFKSVPPLSSVCLSVPLSLGASTAWSCPCKVEEGRTERESNRASNRAPGSMHRMHYGNFVAFSLTSLQNTRMCVCVCKAVCICCVCACVLFCGNFNLLAIYTQIFNYFYFLLTRPIHVANSIIILWQRGRIVSIACKRFISMDFIAVCCSVYKVVLGSWEYKQ